MFFQGERGRFIGFYALALTNGVSPCCGILTLNSLTIGSLTLAPLPAATSR